MMLSGYKISPMEAKVTILNWMFWFAKHRKIKTNSVGFISVRRNDLSGNMEFVYEKLKEKGNLNFNSEATCSHHEHEHHGNCGEGGCGEHGCH